MYFFIRNRKKISIPRSVIGVIPFERLVHIFQSCQYVWKMHSVDEKLAALNQISQKKFLNILEKISGKKDLIIDPYLLKPLEHVVGAGKLRYLLLLYYIYKRDYIRYKYLILIVTLVFHCLLIPKI